MRRRSIRSKLVGLVLASVGVAVVLVASVSAWRDSRRDASIRAEQLHATAQVVASMALEGVRADSPAQAFAAVRAIAHMPGVTYARVEGYDGRTLAETGAGVRLSRDVAVERPGESLSMWRLLSSHSLEASAPVLESGRQVGRVVLLAKTDGVAKQFVGSLLLSAVAAALAALLGLVVAMRMQRGVTGPIIALTRAMDEVQRTHEYDRVAETVSNDEVGDLVSGFNGMLAEIRARDKRIADHLAGLEKTVEERTADLAAAKDAAEDANRAKSDFLATMSHEIRTPMNGIMVMAEMLAAGEMPARQRRFAEVIAKSGSSLLSIINDILDFSKIEAGKLELEATPVDVAEVVDDVTSLFWERARSKRLDLAAYVDPAVPALIAADATRLRQIISNLVNNAIKFTEVGGVLIQVEVDAAGRLRVGVHDTGIGIARDKLAGVFGAFTQADQSTTRKFGGTGLGLAISKRLVEAMNGQIGVDSDPGRGSVFAFRCPMTVIKPAEDWPAFDAGETELSVEGGCSAHALARYLSRAGLTAAQTPDAPVLAIGDANALRRRIGAETPRLCLAEYGASLPGELLRQGRADALLTQPIRRRDLAAALRQVREGRPLSVLQAQQDAAETAQTTLPNFAGARVLVADDSAVNREVAIEALSRLGIAASVVNDGRAAITAVMAEPFDLVLMDGSMPEVDGYEATREIRRLQSQAGECATPIVALTAHVVGSAAEAWREADMDGVLHKPFTLASLAETVGRFLTPCAAPLPTTLAADNLPPAPAAEPVDEALFDPDVAEGLAQMAAQGKADFVERVRRLYRENAPGCVIALRAAADAQTAARAAHALKSMSLNIGARRVSELAGGVEGWCREGHMAETAEIDSLDAALAATLAALDGDAPDADADAAPDADTRQLLKDLKWAIETDGLHLVYQPQVDRDGRSIVGVEALVRWNHPVIGPVHPADFIPLAEQNNLIRPLTDWVLDRALLEFTQRPGITVSVNASALEFGDSDFVDRVLRVLERRAFDPRLLEIEITETAVLAREDQVRANMERFRTLGVCVVLDDFGAGYSSLRLLRLLPFDKLKIDREFITPCCDDQAAATVVHAVIAIGRAMGMKVVAEGVETDNQRSFLRVAGVHAMQGFLFGRPVALEELAAPPPQVAAS